MVEKNELRNREQRLRRAASKKGLYIKKGKCYINYSQYDREVLTGYSVGILEYGLLVAGFDSFNQHTFSIEEAEEYVANCQ